MIVHAKSSYPGYDAMISGVPVDWICVVVDIELAGSVTRGFVYSLSAFLRWDMRAGTSLAGNARLNLLLECRRSTQSRGKFFTDPDAGLATTLIDRQNHKHPACNLSFPVSRYTQ